MGLFDFLHPSAENRRGYSELDRPINRRELAKLVFRDRFFDLIPLNMLLLLVRLPALFFAFTGCAYMLQSMGAEWELFDLLPMLRTFVLVIFPCIAITGPFVKAARIVLRNMARDDFRQPRQCFFAALKSDWGQALLISCITGAIPLLIWAGLTFYGPHLAAGSLLMAIPLMLSALICLLWCMALPLLYTMLGSYRLPLTAQIKNALALTLKHLPRTLGVELLAAAPLLIMPIALLAGSAAGWIIAFLCAYYLLFGFAAGGLLHAFLANYLMETYLNPHIEGAGTHIGMRKIDHQR